MITQELLLKEKKELETKKIGGIIGTVAGFIMIVTGLMGRFFWLIIGLAVIIFGLMEHSKNEKRINEIEYKLAG